MVISKSSMGLFLCVLLSLISNVHAYYTYYYYTSWWFYLIWVVVFIIICVTIGCCVRRRRAYAGNVMQPNHMIIATATPNQMGYVGPAGYYDPNMPVGPAGPPGYYAQPGYPQGAPVAGYPMSPQAGVYDPHAPPSYNETATHAYGDHPNAGYPVKEGAPPTAPYG